MRPLLVLSVCKAARQGPCSPCRMLPSPPRARFNRISLACCKYPALTDTYINPYLHACARTQHTQARVCTHCTHNTHTHTHRWASTGSAGCAATALSRVCLSRPLGCTPSPSPSVYPPLSFGLPSPSPSVWEGTSADLGARLGAVACQLALLVILELEVRVLMLLTRVPLARIRLIRAQHMTHTLHTVRPSRHQPMPRGHRHAE